MLAVQKDRRLITYNVQHLFLSCILIFNHCMLLFLVLGHPVGGGRLFASENALAVATRVLIQMPVLEVFLVPP
jgi:hypothetical protein